MKKTTNRFFKIGHLALTAALILGAYVLLRLGDIVEWGFRETTPVTAKPPPESFSPTIDPRTYEMSANSLLFTLLHEFGHALVHELDLPITGREEDAVDGFAALMLIESSQNDVNLKNSAAHAAYAFGLMWEHARRQGLSIPYWDEHSLEKQRFYNILCLLYGSDPETYSRHGATAALPPARRPKCIAEFEQKLKAWRALLAEHISQSGNAGGQIFTRIGEVKTPRGRQWKATFEQETPFQHVITALDFVFLLPNPIVVEFKECEIQNAFWDPQRKTVTMCFEMFEFTFQLFAEALNPDLAPPLVSREALVGIWKGQGLDDQGHTVVSTLELYPLGGFQQTHFWSYGSTLKVSGVYDVKGNHLVFEIRDWQPRQYCDHYGCRPVQMPPEQRVPFQMPDPQTIRTDQGIYRRQSFPPN